MEEIGKLILSNKKVDDKDIEQLLSNTLKYLPKVKSQWKKLADLWITSSGSREIHVGRYLIFFLRTEVLTYVTDHLPWRELEFLITFFILRQENKLSFDESIISDLLIGRTFLKNCVSDFTENFEKFQYAEPKKCSRSDYISSLKNQNYPRIDEILDKFTHLRRFRSLVQIREILQDFHQPLKEEDNSNESYFVCLTKTTELLQNTVFSPHFPPTDEVSIENMLMPVEMSNTLIQKYRYVFGHLISLQVSDTSFKKLTHLFKNLEPIINVLLENEKRVVVMKFLNKILYMDIDEFEREVEQFDEYNVPCLELNVTKVKAHTDLVDKIIKNWEGVKKEYKYINTQIIELGSLEYISEMLKSFRNLYEIMGNEFNDRINPLLIKIANFKIAQEDFSKEAIFNNIKISMKGFKNWYRYQKSLNIQQRISSALFIMKKVFDGDVNRRNILQGIEEIENLDELLKLEKLPDNCSQSLKQLFDKLNAEGNPKNMPRKSSSFKLVVERLEIHKNLEENIKEIDEFCKFSDLEKLPIYCSEFLEKVFENDIIKNTHKKKLSDKGFKAFIECLQSDKEIDPAKIKNILNDHWKSLKIHYELLKSEGKLTVKNMEACFVTGTTIKQLLTSKTGEIEKEETKMVLDWIPVLSGSCLRNFIIHNNHLLLLLPYNYEVLLKINCEVLFEEKEQTCSLTSNLNFDDLMDFINKVDLQPQSSRGKPKDLNNLIKFGSNDEVSEYEEQNPQVKIEPDNLKFAIIRGDKKIFRQVLEWKGLGSILEKPLNTKDYTPFLLCCELGESEFVKMLIEKNCNPFAKSAFGYSCFHIAAQRNQDDLFKDLLGLTLRLNSIVVPIYPFLRETKYKFKPHHAALQNNGVDVLKLIIKLTNDNSTVINKNVMLKIDSKCVDITFDWQRKDINMKKEVQLKIKETTKTDTYYQINGESEFECNLTSEEQAENKTSFWKLPNGNILHKIIESGYLESLNEFINIFEQQIDEEALFKLIECQYKPEVFANYFYMFQKRKPKTTLDDLLTKNKNWSLLYTAIKYNNIPMIEYLVEKMNNEKWITKTNQGVTPLHLLFELKRKDQVMKLLNNLDLKLNVFKNLKQDHTAESTGRSLLHWVVLNRWDFCQQQIRDELLTLINEVDCFEESPFHYEIGCGYLESLNKFVESFKPIIDETTLFKLIEFQYKPEVFLNYFNKYKDENPNDTLDSLLTKNNKWSLLYTAIKFNNIPMMTYLEKNMNDNKWRTKTNEGITPLYLLFKLKREDQVKKLKSSIVKELKKDHAAASTGRSLLLWVVLNRWDFCLGTIPRDETLSMLFEADCSGTTPLDYAKNTGNQELVDKLNAFIVQKP